MSWQLPKVSLTGNLTEDLEVKKAGSTSVVNCGVAVTERKRGANGTWEDGEAHYFNVTVWGNQADHLAASARKGDRIIVSGVLKQERWETPEGEKRNILKIHADMVGLALQYEDIPTRRAREQGFEHSAPTGTDEPPF